MVDACQDVAIFYETEAMPWEALHVLLADIQLVIMPVTTRLLTKENRAVSEILPFALKNHIPILPVMFENGLDDVFQKTFGDLQYLMPGNIDPTAVPFEQKLEKYLEGVLVGSDTAKRVRDAFDAYTFMSYRKKDRAYAHELMRMIHRDDKYRDIAIWYDEHLVPGENFTEAIQSALAKGKLFTLVVTPSLLEKGNYIMLHEYPVAKEAGKPIMPAEMEKTDKKMLASLYEDIPDSVDVRNKSAWDQAMEWYFRELAEKGDKKDPQHDYLIGLAYLDGIDVEVDGQRAKDLITGAAQEGLMEAMEKLVAMYHDGKGVERDYKKSVEWQVKLVKSLHVAWLENKGSDSLQAYISALWDLGDAQWAIRDLAGASETYREMRSAAGKQIEAGDHIGLRNLSVSYSRSGDIEKALGNLENAKQNCEKALEIRDKLAELTKTAESLRDLSVCYIKLGSIEKNLGNLEGAKRAYKKGFEISARLE
ncbi:MAG: TIR domain-containing protein, partial [Parasporobacterium sp.]|nr:TIR domain-containing protein [Parasporobacterium sp.]